MQLLSRLLAVALALLSVFTSGCGGRPAEKGRPAKPTSFRELSTEECVKLLGHRSPIVRRQAVAELAGRGRAVVGLVVKQLEQQGDVPARAAAAEVLAKLGPQAAEAAPALCQALTDRGWTGRELAATALGEIGPKARLGIGALASVLEADPEAPVRAASAKALGRLAAAGVSLPPEAVECLLRALKDPDPTVQAEAAEALGHCRALTPEALAALENLASCENFIVRQAAEESLRRLRQSANPAGLAQPTEQ